MKLKDFTVSSLKNPVGMDARPYFSYVLTSEKTNVRQVHRHIRVSAGEKTVWEQEKDTDESIFIPYEGPLSSRQRYDVSVSVTDNYGETDTVSGFFETALLKESDWQARWVKSGLPVFPAEKGFAKQPPATMFRRRFTCREMPQKVRLYATCHGIYIPYLNGKRVDSREFAPEHSAYGKVLHYQTYDLTGQIGAGENELSLYVGDGWYLGVKTTPRVENYERRHAVLFQLEMEYPDGTVQTVGSDNRVECAYGPVVSSDLFAGEKYDANLGFWDWQPAQPADHGYANLRAQADTPVTLRGEAPVQRITQTPAGETVLDFGKVLAGRVRMTVRERKGTVVTLTHSEVLDQNGNFFQNTQMPDGGVEQMDQYICDGEKRSYEPLFTYHGFRYVKIEGFSDPKPEDFVARIYTSEGENVGTFQCSEEKLNRLYGNIHNAQRSNFFSIPTDCPQREKAGWTGDIGIYAATALQNSNVTPLLQRWMQSVRADQGENGAVPIVVPYDGGYPMSELFFGPMYEEPGTIGSSGWGDACVLVPWAMYHITGNAQAIRDNLDVMEKWCGYILERCKLPGKDRSVPAELDRWLWNRGYHQGDWLVPSLAGQGGDDPILGPLYQMDHTAQYAAPLYGYHTFALMAQMCRAVGQGEKACRYENVAENMKKAIAVALFDEQGNMPTNLMGAYVLAIAFDVVPEQHKEHVKKKLLGLLEDNGGRLDTGFLSTPYLLDALCTIGHPEKAYDLLYQEKCPGWMYQLDRGATAIWESWDNYEPDGTPKKISFNHYAFGCVDDWITRKICGLQPIGPGFQSFCIQPEPDGRISFARRTFLSSYGRIGVRWERRNGKFHLRCTVPCNTTATVILPSGSQFQVGSGEYEFEE